MKRKENQRRKETEKLIDERKKEEEKLYNEAVKRHWNNQDAETKKRMKRTAYKSVDFHDSKKQFFLKRLFTRKKVKKTRGEQPR